MGRGIVGHLVLVTSLLALRVSAATRSRADRDWQWQKSTRLVPKIHGVTDCSAKHYSTIDNVTILLGDDGGDYVTVRCTSHRVMKTISKFALIINRCQPGPVSAGSCEYYRTLTWTTGVCSFIEAKGVIWTTFVESFNPPAKCPIDQVMLQLFECSPIWKKRFLVFRGSPCPTTK
ncbi:uncharacterized protein LOC117648090 isoform X2 [Thrips palmi]|uniref:Uncharacterized protein LOC117648090 isoform X2 n=1 Tax=Thrips palmi TaxID=161013 RepID=A0A6P8Z7B3_THRPL|nr:uncharacterized protein LOC117648090 isoform X2 [Thrips palmi]